MAPITKLYWLHAITPLHVGVGQGVGFIDLPVMREKVTGWPLVPGSSVKGVLADFHKASKQEDRMADAKLKAAFGISGDDFSNSGSLVFTDARIVCLPVRSYYGTFAWITCPLALRRFVRDTADGEIEALLEGLTVEEGTIRLPEADSDKLQSRLGGTGDGKPMVFLEELNFSVVSCSATTKLSDKISQWVFADKNWRVIFQQRFGIVPNETFDYLCETATEVNARIRISADLKVVEKGALWYEESLPAETILAGIVWCDRVYGDNGISAEDLVSEYCSGELRLQIGGKATIGKGKVRCLFIDGGQSDG